MPLKVFQGCVPRNKNNQSVDHLNLSTKFNINTGISWRLLLYSKKPGRSDSRIQAEMQFA